jgi:uncharacterized ferritin-like protein (DUF455 family)
MSARPPYDPAMFAPAPARDGRFDVKDQWIDCHNDHADEAERAVEFLHRQMNEEIDSIECSARNLSDFPEAEWDLRMAIARQCYDEARHAEMFRRAVEARGGHVGAFPVLNFQYRIITKIDDLAGRLAVQNRSFEAEGVDAIQPAIEAALQRGDTQMAGLFDAQLADEIGHVRFANEYLARVTSRDPRCVMSIGRALDYSGRAFVQVMGQGTIESVGYRVNQSGRLEAGFRDGEVRDIREIRRHREESAG